MMLAKRSRMLERRIGAPWGLVTSVAVALSLIGGVPAAHAAAAPDGDFEQLIAEADAHAVAGRHAEALESYAAAFEAMPTDLRISTVGEFVALEAGQAAVEDFRARGDAASLVRGQTVLRMFLADLEVAS